MKHLNCLFYMAMGVGATLLFKAYENEIKCICQKMMKKEKELISDGLDLE